MINNILQEQVVSYFDTLGYSVVERSEELVVVDKIDIGGVRDTRIIWTPEEPEHDWEFSRIENRLLTSIQNKRVQYPESRGWILSYTFGGFSQEFLSNVRKHNVLLRVPIQFFDMPFKYEEAPKYQSVISDLRKAPVRIPQPFSIMRGGNLVKGNGDLLEELWQDFRSLESPKLRIVVGPAGIGKSWLFRSLFSRLYTHFINQKRRLEVFPRPIPLLPSYIKKAGTLRTRELFRSFMDTEVASVVPQSTFEWLVVHGYATWLFDGLDELYAEDQDFFNNLADILTRPVRNNRAGILICARESLLSSCEPFVEFLEDYGGEGDEPVIKIYRLEGWENPSKRAFASLHFDAPRDDLFMKYITRTKSLRELSSLPYYCELLRKSFMQGDGKEFVDDFSLLQYAVGEIVRREQQKGLLRVEDFQKNGLMEWLEAVAADYYATGFKGVDRLDIEVYAYSVLTRGLSEAEKRNIVTSLVQFPLFAAGGERGTLSFEHELIAEYLAGQYWLKRLEDDPYKASQELGERLDFSETLIARFLASRIAGQQNTLRKIYDVLSTRHLPGRGFANLLQLLLMALPDRDALKPLKNVLVGKDLSYVKFVNRDLRGFSFENCDLTNTLFSQCDLREARYHGARLSGTRFEKISKDAWAGAEFGDLVHLDSVYVGKRRIENHKEFSEWLQTVTGKSSPVIEPCASAKQLRALFLKFVRPDGTGRRDELKYRALVSGKRFPGAKPPEDFVKACLSAGYLQDTRWHERIRRVPGKKYSEMVRYVTDWEMSEDIRKILDALCSEPNCSHVPRQ